jgi:hypothetical protein
MPADVNNQMAGPLGSRKMPKPGEKNAPVFDPDKPEELGRFFERMEDWFEDDRITTSEEKKKKIVKYLDADSETQWKALSKFVDGTYTEFKAQVMRSYPKAEEVMKGSMTAFRRKLRKYGPIAADERDELLALIRMTNAEVAKLKEIKPPIHTNRELVELFLARLAPDFAARIAQKLSVQRLIGEKKEGDLQERNPEDMFDIEEVMDMARQAATEATHPFSRYLGSTSMGRSDTTVKLEEVVAKLADSVDVQTKYNRQMDQKLTSIQTFMNQPRTAIASSSNAPVPPYFRGPMNPGQNTSQGNNPNICFYCRGDEGHRILDCPHVNTHLDLGWIKKDQGQIRLPNGQRIPRDGAKTMKEVIESANRRPGIIPMSKIQDKSAFFQDIPLSTSQRGSEDNDNMCNLMELIQKVGPDRVQQLIQSSRYNNATEEDWEQNFY